MEKREKFIEMVLLYEYFFENTFNDKHNDAEHKDFLKKANKQHKKICDFSQKLRLSNEIHLLYELFDHPNKYVKYLSVSLYHDYINKSELRKRIQEIYDLPDPNKLKPFCYLGLMSFDKIGVK